MADRSCWRRCRIDQYLVSCWFCGNFLFLVDSSSKQKKKRTPKFNFSLNKGDEIVTVGGIVGKINKVKDDFIILQVSNDEMRLQKRR